MPITRPRISALAARSNTAHSGTRQKLCTNPAANSSTSPSGSQRAWPKHRMATNQAAVASSMTRPARSAAWLTPTATEPASAPMANAAAR